MKIRMKLRFCSAHISLHSVGYMHTCHLACVFFPALKCFSPAAGHTVVETLCLRKDSGTDVTAGYVTLCAHWLTKLSSVVLSAASTSSVQASAHA